MKVSNIDIIDTVADEKKLNMCLIQGWCYKKSLSAVPKSKKYAIERCRRLAHMVKISYVFTFLLDATF